MFMECLFAVSALSGFGTGPPLGSSHPSARDRPVRNKVIQISEPKGNSGGWDTGFAQMLRKGFPDRDQPAFNRELISI